MRSRKPKIILDDHGCPLQTNSRLYVRIMFLTAKMSINILLITTGARSRPRREGSTTPVGRPAGTTARSPMLGLPKEKVQVIARDVGGAPCRAARVTRRALRRCSVNGSARHAARLRAHSSAATPTAWRSATRIRGRSLRLASITAHQAPGEIIGKAAASRRICSRARKPISISPTGISSSPASTARSTCSPSRQRGGITQVCPRSCAVRSPASANHEPVGSFPHRFHVS